MQMNAAIRRVALTVSPLVGLGIVTVGCSGDNGTDPDDEPTASMEAEIDGEPWTANQALDGPIANFEATDEDVGLFQLNGVHVDDAGTTRRITIQLPGYTDPGTYTLAGPGSDGFGYYILEDDPDLGNALYGTVDGYEGTITIASLDVEEEWVTGTFEFEAVNDNTGETVAVTAGEFSGGIELLEGRS